MNKTNQQQQNQCRPHWSVEECYLLHILKDKIQLSSPAEGLFQLNNVLLLEGAEHFKLPECCFFNLLIFCMETKRKSGPYELT